MPDSTGVKKAITTLNCIKCNTELMKPSEQVKEFIGLVCGNKECERYGLLTLVGKKEEKPIIEPPKIITP